MPENKACSAGWLLNKLAHLVMVTLILILNQKELNILLKTILRLRKYHQDCIVVMLSPKMDSFIHGVEASMVSLVTVPISTHMYPYLMSQLNKLN